MPFVDAAKAETPSRLKCGMYGPAGAGKSYTAQLFAEGLAKVRGRKVAVVDTEGSHKFLKLARPSDPVHPAPFVFDVLNTRSLAETLREVQSLDPKVYGVVIIDSISHLWDAAIQAYEGKMTSADTIPMQAWGKIKKPYKSLISFLLASNFDVFILGRQKNIWKDVDGELENVGVGMKAEGETAYEPDCLVRMESIRDRSDPTRSTYIMHVEKDRTSVLAGRHISNPSFKTIEPMLPMLGEVHIDPATVAAADDERIAIDGELLTEQGEKARGKDEKSVGILIDFQAKFAAATDLATLGNVAKELKKVSRYLSESHMTILRELYEERRKVLAEALAGKV